MDRYAHVSTSVHPGSNARRVAVVVFAVSSLAGIGLAIVYALGGQPQAEGALLGTALLALGVGLVVWAHWFMPHGPFAQEREPLASTPADRAAFDDTLARMAC